MRRPRIAACVALGALALACSSASEEPVTAVPADEVVTPAEPEASFDESFPAPPKPTRPLEPGYYPDPLAGA